MRSVLHNHGRRIGASVMMVISPEGQVIAETQRGAAPSRAFPFRCLGRRRVVGRERGLQSHDATLYQIVLVPNLAPKLIAWVAMGFPVDDAWASGLSRSPDWP